ncbi:MAG: hypothetical protein P4L99_27830 [Chthoniobacter sp.]|nr:hypothetical protein [Chthoniobacter sp.]
MTPAQKHDLLEAVCHAIEERLKDLAIQRCQGIIDEESFISSVLDIEARDVTPQGLTLTASQSSDGWTVFQLKMNGTNETCAAFEFLPQTGEFRRGQDCDR